MPGGGPAERRGRLEQAPVSGAGEAGRSPPPESNTFGSELCSSSHKQTNRVQEGPLPSDPSLLGSRCLSYWCGDSPGPSASHGAAGLLCGRRQRRVPGEGRARRGEAGAEAGGSGAAAAPLPGDSGERAGGAPGRPILRTGQRAREGDPRLAGGHLRDRTAGQGMSGDRSRGRGWPASTGLLPRGTRGPPRRCFAALTSGEPPRPRCGGSGLAAVRQRRRRERAPGSGSGSTGGDAALAVCAYWQSRGVCEAMCPYLCTFRRRSKQPSNPVTLLLVSVILK
ncbi:collagen alpha-1(I) chain-like [Corvus hawaiiensis]|uniref:collagen alpha-1(I) chain-like n=1 Tax=Corvus hawaiiensis TaxID=134902 RepID=UPI002019C1F5|nr:collagen alpha-1(I) chain-like [Corvus hawaiiensis]